MKISFNVRKNKNTSLNDEVGVMISVNHKGKRHQFSVPDVKVKLKNWDYTKKRSKSDKMVNNRLDAIDLNIRKEYQEDFLYKKYDPDALLAMVRKHVDPQEHMMQEEKKKKEELKRQKEEQKNRTLKVKFEKFIEYKKSKKQSKDVIIKHKNAFKQLAAVVEVNYAETVTEKDVEVLTKNLIKKGYANSSIKKVLSNINEFLTKTKTADLKEKIKYINKQELKEKIDDDENQFPLTIKEVQQLIEYRSPDARLDRIREIALLLIFTSTRYNELHVTRCRGGKNRYFFTVNKADLQDTPEPILHIRIQKIKKYFYKYIHPKAFEILEKYNYKVPSHTDKHFNHQFRLLLKEMGINRKVVEVTVVGEEKKLEKVKIWNAISAHHLRRTLPNIAVKNGASDLDVDLVLLNHKPSGVKNRYITPEDSQIAACKRIHQFIKNLF